MERTQQDLFDVRVFHPGALSNQGALQKAYKKHEAEKKRAYGERILQVEKATFTPLVFSISGGVGREAQSFMKRLASLISDKRGTSYSDTISYVRRKLRICLLRATLASVRGFRGSRVRVDGHNSDINVIQRVVATD